MGRLLKITALMGALGMLVAEASGCSGGSSCDGCTIDGECPPAGTPSLGDPCMACLPEKNTSGWSDNEGGLCDDGVYCTTNETCTAGVCGGGVPTCDDGVACNGTESCYEDLSFCEDGQNQCDPGEFCDAELDQCVINCIDCSIDRSCYYDYQRNPRNACQVCNSAVDVNAWINAEDGTACDNGMYCDGADTCLDGACAVHGGDPCGDDLFCNGVEVCDEQSHACLHPNDACAEGESCLEDEDRCCTAHDHLDCGADGDVVWIDSCGQEVEVAEDCPAAPNGGCLSAACVCLAGWTGTDCGRCVVYVTTDGDDDANDGSAWDQAKATLNAAITAATEAGCQVWVKEGTYYADPSNRDVTIQMVPGVDLLGGFAGTEIDPDQREIEAHPTVLEGEIGDPDQVNDNTDTIVTAANNALLDGFTLTHAYALDVQGGMHIENISQTVRNCTFIANEGWFGGAMAIMNSNLKMSHCRFEANPRWPSLYMWGSSVELLDVAFVDNTSQNRAAGIYVEGQTDLSCTNCLFEGNTGEVGAITCENSQNVVTLVNSVFFGNSGSYAGAIQAGYGRLIMRNCTLVGNTSTNPSGDYYTGGISVGSASVVMTNCILWGNTTESPDDTLSQEQIYYRDSRPYVRYSTVQGDEVYPGIGNLNLDPLFENTDPGAGDIDLHLGAGSQCIDGGSERTLLPDFADLDGDSDTEEPTPLDFELNPRVSGGDVDQGAYESQ
ncbi:MAG TPA: right-handed parallel beta-helix repeat-containing protein [Myxococcota bacterium]|nr:right-handed parallel beta-helix repeat-containing protein [Myxococcota bacterium]